MPDLFEAIMSDIPHDPNKSKPVSNVQDPKSSSISQKASSADGASIRMLVVKLKSNQRSLPNLQIIH